MPGPAAVPKRQAPGNQTRQLLIVAQDPSVTAGGKVLTAVVDVPFEELDNGPCGYRVKVIDYDASSGALHPPARLPFELPEGGGANSLLSDYAFHAQNVYAIVMRTLAHFERALGRRVGWSFDGHQVHVAPHAFNDANAFYSKRDRALFFGYFTGKNGGTVYSCLSHDVVAHETTHALLDGLRERFTDASSPDQAAFHEGFSDVVALLSMFSLERSLETLLDLRIGQTGAAAADSADRTVDKRWLEPDELKRCVLLGLGEQMGMEMDGEDGRKAALRRSVELPASPKILETEEFLEPHRRGEVFVAAMMNAFLEIWCKRIATLGTVLESRVDRARVAEDGATAARHLLTMAIRALDYCPATDLQFCDYLSALLTADMELQPDDSRYGYRRSLINNFAKYGITPIARGDGANEGVWEPPKAGLDYSATHFEAMQRDADEVFRFVWQNRQALELCPDAYTRVLSVRPCVRLSSDGFTLHETVAEYVQMLTVRASELRGLSWQIFDGLPESRKSELNPFPVPVGLLAEDIAVTLYGGGSLIFDEYGHLKYHIRNKVLNADRQSRRLQYLWESGAFDAQDEDNRRFADLHRMRRTGGAGVRRREEYRDANFF